MLAHVWATVHVHVLPCMYATQGHCVGDRLTIKGVNAGTSFSVYGINGRDRLHT